METTRAEQIAEFLPLVDLIARSLRSRLPAGVELEDLISAGRLALVAAVDRFDASRGAGLRTYLNYRIRGAMCDEIRAMVGRVGHPAGDAKRAAYLRGVSLDAFAHSDEIGVGGGQTPHYPDWLLHRHLAAGLATLTKREREVLHALYHGDLNMRQAGHVLGVHESRVCQLKAAALGKLAKYLQAATREKAAVNR